MATTYQIPTFAWKYEDGDKYPDKEGYPGCMVFRFSGAQRPKCKASDGNGGYLDIDAPGEIKRGDYIRISGSVSGNDSKSNPGVYLNHYMLERCGYGTEIVSGPTAAETFSATPVVLPPGASATPVASAVPPASGAPAGPLAPPPPVAPPAAPPAPTAVYTPPVAPAHDFVDPTNMGAPADAPVAPPPPAAPPAAAPRQMTAKAEGGTYVQMKAAGWTDATLIEAGYLAS